MEVALGALITGVCTVIVALITRYQRRGKPGIPVGDTDDPQSAVRALVDAEQQPAAIVDQPAAIMAIARAVISSEDRATAALADAEKRSRRREESLAERIDVLEADVPAYLGRITMLEERLRWDPSTPPRIVPPWDDRPPRRIGGQQ